MQSTKKKRAKVGLFDMMNPARSGTKSSSIGAATKLGATGTGAGSGSLAVPRVSVAMAMAMSMTREFHQASTVPSKQSDILAPKNFIVKRKKKKKLSILKKKILLERMKEQINLRLLVQQHQQHPEQPSHETIEATTTGRSSMPCIYMFDFVVMEEIEDDLEIEEVLDNVQELLSPILSTSKGGERKGEGEGEEKYAIARINVLSAKRTRDVHTMSSSSSSSTTVPTATSTVPASDIHENNDNDNEYEEEEMLILQVCFFDQKPAQDAAAVLDGMVFAGKAITVTVGEEGATPVMPVRLIKKLLGVSTSSATTASAGENGEGESCIEGALLSSQSQAGKVKGDEGDDGKSGSIAGALLRIDNLISAEDVESEDADAVEEILADVHALCAPYARTGTTFTSSTTTTTTTTTSEGSGGRNRPEEEEDEGGKGKEKAVKVWFQQHTDRVMHRVHHMPITTNDTNIVNSSSRNCNDSSGVEQQLNKQQGHDHEIGADCQWGVVECMSGQEAQDYVNAINEMWRCSNKDSTSSACGKLFRAHLYDYDAYLRGEFTVNNCINISNCSESSEHGANMPVYAVLIQGFFTGEELSGDEDEILEMCSDVQLLVQQAYDRSACGSKNGGQKKINVSHIACIPSVYNIRSNHDYSEKEEEEEEAYYDAIISLQSFEDCVAVASALAESLIGGAHYTVDIVTVKSDDIGSTGTGTGTGALTAAADNDNTTTTTTASTSIRTELTVLRETLQNAARANATRSSSSSSSSSSPQSSIPRLISWEWGGNIVNKSRSRSRSSTTNTSSLLHTICRFTDKSVVRAGSNGAAVFIVVDVTGSLLAGDTQQQPSPSSPFTSKSSGSSSGSSSSSGKNMQQSDSGSGSSGVGDKRAIIGSNSGNRSWAEVVKAREELLFTVRNAISTCGTSDTSATQSCLFSRVFNVFPTNCRSSGKSSSFTSTASPTSATQASSTVSDALLPLASAAVKTGEGEGGGDVICYTACVQFEDVAAAEQALLHLDGFVLAGKPLLVHLLLPVAPISPSSGSNSRSTGSATSADGSESVMVEKKDTVQGTGSMSPMGKTIGGTEIKPAVLVSPSSSTTTTVTTQHVVKFQHILTALVGGKEETGGLQLIRHSAADDAADDKDDSVPVASAIALSKNNSNSGVSAEELLQLSEQFQQQQQQYQKQQTAECSFMAGTSEEAADSAKDGTRSSSSLVVAAVAQVSKYKAARNAPKLPSHHILPASVGLRGGVDASFGSVVTYPSAAVAAVGLAREAEEAAKVALEAEKAISAAEQATSGSRSSRKPLYGRNNAGSGALTSLAAASHQRTKIMYYIANEDVNASLKALLTLLATFQRRIKELNPLKAKQKQRFVVGMKQVTNSVKSKKVRLVLLAPNTEANSVVDSKLASLIFEAVNREIPVMYCLSKRLLGKAAQLSMKQAAIGIVDPDGAYEEYRKVTRFMDRNAPILVPESAYTPQSTSTHATAATAAVAAATTAAPSPSDPPEVATAIM